MGLRPISITPVLNGFVVNVGCQALAYNNVDKLLVDMGNYLRDPDATEKRIIAEEGINARHTMRADLEPVMRTERPYENAAIAGCVSRAVSGQGEEVETKPVLGRP